MTATTRTVTLSQIADEALDYVDQVPALDPSHARPVIVEVLPSGTMGIIDGFHRTAGMVRWCRREGVSLDACEVTVVTCDDEDLLATAAEPGEGQEDAIEAIYEAAGVA